MLTAQRIKLVSNIVFIGFIGIIIALIFSSMLDYQKKTDEKQLERMTELIQKASVQCYALEGQYPPNLKYLEDNYGLVLYTDRFVYFYNAEISNIMPDIVVRPIGAGVDDGL